MTAKDGRQGRGIDRASPSDNSYSRAKRIVSTKEMETANLRSWLKLSASVVAVIFELNGGDIEHATGHV